MSQEINVKEVGQELKDAIEKVATPENIQAAQDVLGILISAWLQSTAKDKQLIQILIIIIASISAFLAVAQGLP